MRSLRLPNEGDEAFRERANRDAAYAHLLTDAALANDCIRELIADPKYPTWTEQCERRSPTIRLDFEQAICIAGIGEGIAATRNKHWGHGPQIQPLDPDDPVDPIFITYLFKENSLYNRRFEQRKRLKELLGKRYRPLVTKAKQYTRTIFLDVLTAKEAFAIRSLLNMDPTIFWRLCKGKCFVDLPDQPGSINRTVLDSIPEKPQQLPLPFDRPRSREDFSNK